MPELREAASFEGLVVLAVIYFMLSLLSKSGRKGRAERTGRPPPDTATATQEEGFSLEAVLRQIERVRQAKQGEARPAPPSPRRLEPKAAPVREGRMGAVARGKAGERPRALPAGRMAQAPQTERGPLGRHGRTGLPPAEEAEERTSHEDEGSLEVPGRLEILDETRGRPREVVDQDEGIEAVVARRLREAEARNRPLSAADHVAFDKIVRQGDLTAAAPRRYPTGQLRQAFIWREILGPPKSLE